jgi:hypothetical protein
VVNTAKLSPEQEEEYRADLAESNRRYSYAFDIVQSHTSVAEKREFWSLFGKAAARDFENDEEGWLHSHTDEVGKEGSTFSNPMHQTSMQQRPSLDALGGEATL